jgi:hypothetical protein
MIDTNKDVILAAATGYIPEKIEVFVKSLSHTDFDGVLVLIIYKEQELSYRSKFSFEKKFEIKYQITIMGKLRVNSQYTGWLRIKFIRNCIGAFYSWRIDDHDKKNKYLALSVYSYPHVARFFEYKKFIDNNKNIRNVLLTDVRDVLFQVNPFKELGSGLYVGMENSEFSIGQEKFNKKWILDAYGTEIFNQLMSKQISCSGVTLGDIVSINIYVNKMLDEFMKQPYAKMSNRIYDQAMHNKLIGYNQLKNLVVCQPFDSKIVTLGLFQESQILLKNRQVINRDGSLVAIVHQYDRHPRLFAQYID